MLRRGMLMAGLAAIPLGVHAESGKLSPAEYYRLWQQADRQVAAGEFAAAVPLYERLRAANPGDGLILYRLAVARSRSGDAAGALGPAMEALELGYGIESRTAYRIAGALASAGQEEAALDWIERSLQARWPDRPRLQTDEAFAALRTNPRFRELAGFAPSGERTRVQGWRLDLDFFLEEARRLHAGPSRIAWSEDYTAAVDALKGRVAELDDREIAVEIQRLLVRLGDGHSSLWAVDNDLFQWQALPVRFYLFADGLFIIDAAESHADLIGRKVVAIGGRRLDDVLEDLEPYVSRDNRMGLLAGGPWRLRRPAFLQAMGYAEPGQPVRLTLGDGAGSREVELETDGGRFGRRLPAAPGSSPLRGPLWLRNTEAAYWDAPLPEMDAHYIQFNQVGDGDGRTIPEFVEAVRVSLERNGATNLILDLRHNGGGNNFLIWPIIRLLAWHQMTAAHRRIFVITGRTTFSACQDLVNFIDRALDATFVGEPSASKPNFTGETTTVILPYSRLRMSISSRYWQDSFPEDRRPFLSVSIPVALTSRDYFGHRDPVMEALREVLGTRRASK